MVDVDGNQTVILPDIHNADIRNQVCQSLQQDECYRSLPIIIFTLSQFINHAITAMCCIIRGHIAGLVPEPCISVYIYKTYYVVVALILGMSEQE